MENDLEKMDKTMPYTVPEGFFEAMEERLMQEVAQKKKSKLPKVVLWTGLAVAASLALLLVLRQGLSKVRTDSFEQVEMAFNQLNDNDQQLILDYYEELDDLDNY